MHVEGDSILEREWEQRGVGECILWFWSVVLFCGLVFCLFTWESETFTCLDHVKLLLITWSCSSGINHRRVITLLGWKVTCKISWLLCLAVPLMMRMVDVFEKSWHDEAYTVSTVDGSNWNENQVLPCPLESCNIAFMHCVVLTLCSLWVYSGFYGGHIYIWGSHKPYANACGCHYLGIILRCSV